MQRGGARAWGIDGDIGYDDLLFWVLAWHGHLLRERAGKEGKERERKGKKGKERERKGKEGKGRERKGKEGKGRSGWKWVGRKSCWG